MFILALQFASLASAQITCSGATGNVANTFNLCISNYMQNGNDPQSACQNLKDQNAQYYTCLCQKSQGVSGCFQQFCSSSSQAVVYQQAQSQYCGAASAILNPASAGPTNAQATGLPVLTVATGGVVPTQAAHGSTTTTGAQFNNAGRASILSSAMVFGEIICLAVLANIL
ncbi:hypothetical protein HDV04_003546 [Boothiomyces sp. JEL0838]|nr:hypothetical protein HDV04_003546 [Boothiomyces sp. JEL0838]